MVSKTFDHTVPFYEIVESGRIVRVPLVQVSLMGPLSTRYQLSLLFDTGADVTSLRADLYPLLGISAWDVGQRVPLSTAGGNCYGYQYEGVIELFGKSIRCPIQLIPMPPNPLMQGLLGREIVFNEFGFGFWESANELYVASEPRGPQP
jgi:hypothetical protein